MSRLYVANCTPQKDVFSFRLLNTRRIIEREIRAGEQEVVADLDRDQLENVIDQNEQYGMFAATDVARAQKYIHRLWSMDKPVSHAQMKQALERNLQLKTLEGHQTRQTAAASMAQTIQQNLDSPDAYTGMRLAIEDKGGVSDMATNEIFTHRRDGQYERGTDFEAPLKKASRRRRVN